MNEEPIKIYIKDEIVHGEATVPFIMDLGTAKKLVNIRLNLSDSKSYPILVDYSKMMNITKDAREYLIKEGSEGVTAGAFITTTVVSRIWINLFITMYRPPQPTKVFTNKQKAVDWLKQFIK